ncbi:hypothetical protein Ddc_02169 [Ditylenchus destructor]|nr:hypothetical protein Ddc_02169 [Ditylenchus destructor]
MAVRNIRKRRMATEISVLGNNENAEPILYRPKTRVRTKDYIALGIILLTLLMSCCAVGLLVDVPAMSRNFEKCFRFERFPDNLREPLPAAPPQIHNSVPNPPIPSPTRRKQVQPANSGVNPPIRGATRQKQA